jgi:hypothetical protein
MATTALAGMCCAGWSSPSAAAFSGFDEQTATTLVRMFTDSDHIGVRSFMGDYSVSLKSNASLSIHLKIERVTIPAIKATPGSAEAIDAITTASRPISGNAYQDFVKVRNEVQSELTQGPAVFGYYYSKESDYLAQQISGHVSRELMDDQLNLSVGSSYGWDAIEPLADDDTNHGTDHKTTLHVNTVATRVLTPTTLVRVGAEVNMVSGLQHNPYRNVYAGGTNVPERHPDHRQRRDAFVKINQYMNNRSSLKLSYRLYNDDWGITSHEVETRLSQYVTQGLFAQYEYRYYTQNAAYFYRDEYVSTYGVDGYLTGDYRMAPLSSHLFGFTINFDLGVMAADLVVLNRTALRFNYERYFNSNNYSANILETGLDFRF